MKQQTYEQWQNQDKPWAVYRSQGTRSNCGNFTTRSEASRAVAQLQKLFPDSVYRIEFEGKFQAAQGDPRGVTQ